MTFIHLKARVAQLLFSLIGILVLAFDASASERKIEAEVLLKSTEDWRGVTLPTYSEGQPEVTVAKITIPAGMALPLHEHPYMTAGVIVQGTIEVRTDSGDTHIARAGDAVIELVNQAHGGANIGDEDAVILVVYAGIEGEPVTVPLTTP
ncbi:MAG: cupin domain-containing protein [Proteobacteria bacterium]|nr:MAG: cupin domain-containing protein [Pseudomonadota bacterium]